MKTEKQILKETYDRVDEVGTFEELCEPLIKWLCETKHPHTTIIVDAIHAELLSGEKVFSCEKYIID